MLITNLNLTNYRSYSTLDLDLSKGVSIFIGKNGEGKTNIAESILYLTFLNSHRASGNTPLIKLGNQAAYITLIAKFYFNIGLMIRIICSMKIIAIFEATISLC
mgnify:CR=1 FL=1